MKTVNFNTKNIEVIFREEEKKLFNTNNIHIVKYRNFDVETFDELNSKFLKEVAGNYIVYCLWVGESENELKPYYVGQAKNRIARQRLRNHLTKKNEKTGAKLKKIIECLNEKKIIGVSYLIINPYFMRTSFEEWIINENYDSLEWNKNK